MAAFLVPLALIAFFGQAPPNVPSAPKQNAIFVPANDVSLVISTERTNYRVQEPITVRYHIVNISNGPLYVPRGWEVTGCLEFRPPHISAGFENSAGQHFLSQGFGFSCPGPPPTVVERIRKGAVLLNPGDHFDGTLRLDPKDHGFPPGVYRIEAVLRGWKGDEFTDAEWTDLVKSGGSFLRGEVPASARVMLTR